MADWRTSSELAREKMWSRIHLIPLLQAEEDRDLVRRTLASKAMEKELLGAETDIYHSGRYVSMSCDHRSAQSLISIVSSALRTPSRQRMSPNRHKNGCPLFPRYVVHKPAFRSSSMSIVRRFTMLAWGLLYLPNNVLTRLAYVCTAT